MNRFKFTLRRMAIVPALLALTACAGLQDVDHRWCPPEEVVAAVPVQEKVTLQADALFKFDRGDLAGLLPEGRATLDELAEKLLTGYATIDTIELIGHTDRLGTVEYNQALSERRADTVMAYLQSKGVDYPMTAVGRGKLEPVTEGCVGDTATSALIQCLQPDRRVDVLITGIRKE
ncbi:MAG TPA: OmpA family protein [Paenalcaligenes sp.]|nr:OmpA family protein [Paenalcaligenes sp.]